MARKMTMRTYQVKNSKQKKEYQTSLGTTDYDIPMFGYKSAFLIMFSVFGSLLITPMLCYALGLDYRPVTVIVSGLATGFSVGYSQFFIERKKGATRNFWIVSLLIGFCASLIVMIMVYTGWLL